MKALRYTAIFLALVALSGCSVLGGPGAQNSKITQRQVQDLEHINSHLQMMREITAADYQQQLDLFTRVRDESQARNDARAALRYALILTTRGHPNTDIGRGYTQLTRLIDAPGVLSLAELNLARVIAREAAYLMILETRNAELNDLIADTRTKISSRGRSSQVSLQQAQERLEQAEIEIDALRTELADAQAKLDAIKNIEVSSE